MFQITSANDVSLLMRKHNYDILIDLAKSCDEDEYGKAVLNRLMKDLLSTKVGELLRELLKKGATIETKAKPGPKPGQRKKSPAPASAPSPGRKRKQPTITAVAEAAAAVVEEQRGSEEEEDRAFDSPATKKTR